MDDFFGASKAGVQYSGGVCLELLAELVGLPCKASKSVDGVLDIIVLGARIAVELATRKISVGLDPCKAVRWQQLMLDIQRTGYCSAEGAQKMAGRLTFAVTVSLGKVGRAFVRPFFAQANQPLPGGRASHWLLQACVWWTQYFERRPMASLPVGGDERKRVLAWTDAAGASRKLSAVVHVAGRWFYTHMLVPEAVWNQLLPRRDNQIAMQEFLALPMLLSTFGPALQGCLLLQAVDNQGVWGPWLVAVLELMTST